jgi:hypothetical protein
VKFDVTLISAGFSVNGVDQCVYYRHGVGYKVILCLYVNGILIFGISIDVINEVKTFLCQSFEIKDLGDVDVILNIKLIKRRECDYSNAILLCGKGFEPF